MKESLSRPKKIEISLLQNNLSSLNVSKSAVNPISGICTPSVSSLSFRELTNRDDSSFSLSLCRDEDNPDSIKNRFFIGK